jgi:hypothetical protein
MKQLFVGKILTIEIHDSDAVERYKVIEIHPNFALLSTHINVAEHSGYHHHHSCLGLFGEALFFQRQLKKGMRRLRLKISRPSQT